MENLISIFVNSVFVGNILLAYFLGMCSFLAVSNNMETSFGLGMAVVFVLTITAPANWLVHHYLLAPGALAWAGLPGIDLSYLKFITFIAILTGLLHMTGHLQVKKFTKIPRTNSGIILGIFEVFLGLVLLLTPYITLQDQPFLSFVTIAWALAGGVIIFFDALGIRREAKLKQKAEDS